MIMDMDEIPDTDDQCPNGHDGAGNDIGDSNRPTPPTPIMDGCKNSEDVDDDNDGLIEIATRRPTQ